MKKMNKKGFTLIEMLAVIAIIAVLVAIIVPAVGSSTTKAKAATNAANLRSAAASITIDYVNGTATVANDGTVSGYTITPPIEKANANDGITGGTFSAKLINGEIVCTFGTDGTIANYSSVAETGNAYVAPQG
jgi:prepilin-type N-terminal cleavage/methylation domain-containing protein